MSDSRNCCWSRAQEKIPTLQNPSLGFILQNTVIPFSNESRFGLWFIGLTALKIDQIQFKLIFYSFFSPWPFLSEGSCSRVPLATAASCRHWPIQAAGAPGCDGRAPAGCEGCGKGPTPILWFCGRTCVGLSWCHLAWWVQFAVGSLPWGITVPSPRGILRIFGLASFTPVHDKMSVQMSSASQHYTGLCLLNTSSKFQLSSNPTQAACWKSSFLHQASSQSGVSPRELHKPRLLVPNPILIPHGTFFFPPPD